MSRLLNQAFEIAVGDLYGGTTFVNRKDDPRAEADGQQVQQDLVSDRRGALFCGSTVVVWMLGGHQFIPGVFRPRLTAYERSR